MTESYVVRKEACPRCTEKGRDTSKNNLAIYSNGGAYCWSADCDYRVISKDYLKDEIIELPIYESNNLSSFTKDDWNELKKQTSTNPRGWRGLDQSTCEVYHVYHQFNVETGQVVKQFYPLSSATDFCGMKVKVAEPKNFYAEGSNKIDTTELFGQSVFKKSLAKSILITEGELDALSAYQMLLPLAKDYPPTPCVSSTVGSGGYKQFKHQYEYLNRFDRIILCVDQDKAGQASIPNIISVLPKGKVLVMEFSKKDANKMLTENLEKEFINAFFKAKPYNPNGIRGSSGLYDEIIKDIQTPKLPFPPFMHKIQEMLCGGLKVGSIMNLGAACVDKDTEFLSQNGWKKISEYVQGDLVLQYNEDGSATLVEPIKYVKEPCNEPVYHFNKKFGADMVLTENHRFAYFNAGNLNDLKVKPTKEVVDIFNRNSRGFRGLIKNVFSYDGAGIDLTEGELRLQVAVIADGRIVAEGKDNYTQMRFSKERKYLRLLELCKHYNLRYKDNGFKINPKYKSGKEYEIIVWPKLLDKSFDSKYYSCSQAQLKIIADEVLHWDGCLSTNTFSTVKKDSADFIQFCFTALGYKTAISLDERTDKYESGVAYTIIITTTGRQHTTFEKASTSTSKIDAYQMPDGFKYCFEVPSSYLVLRRNNFIFITGNSGCGKTTFVNEMIYYWIFNSPYKVGIISMELDSGQYGGALVSRHLSKKLNLFVNPDDAVAYLQQPDVVAAIQTLHTTPDGQDRFHLIEERDGDVERMKELIQQLIIQCDCKVIIIDPLQDLMAGMSNDAQEVFLKWMKEMIKSFGIIFININHVRKSPTGKESNSAGAFITEEDFAGSSTIFKSASFNLLFTRNKYSDDPVEKNKTCMYASKNRQTGITGDAGCFFYENSTHTLHDFEVYMTEHPELFVTSDYD